MPILPLANTVEIYKYPDAMLKYENMTLTRVKG